jgi:hypothetical protein
MRGASDDDATIELKPGARRPGARGSGARGPHRSGAHGSGVQGSDAKGLGAEALSVPTRRRLFATLAVGTGAAAVAGCGICGWLLWPRHAVLPPAPAMALVPPRPLPAPAPPERFAITTADEATILAHVAEHLTVFQFADNPNIMVLDFPSLRMQGEMLNRIASLTEKAGLPHNRVLNDADLDAAIRARGDTMETYYYGHDYPAGALAGFFALADQERIALDPQEQELRALLQQLGWFAPGALGGLISLTRTNETITEATRATILHHELSHGEFFSDPDYARYVHGFWLTEMTDDERKTFRQFLGSMDYDVHLEELMYNEMQAYLMFTYDPRFFLPANVNMKPERRVELQVAFLKNMPESWLKMSLARHLRQAAD